MMYEDRSCIYTVLKVLFTQDKRDLAIYMRFVTLDRALQRVLNHLYRE